MKGLGKAKKAVSKTEAGIKTKKIAKKEKNQPSEGALKLKELVDRATKTATKTKQSVSPKDSSTTKTSASQPVEVDNIATGLPEQETKPKVKPRLTKKKGKIDPKDYIDHPNVVFVGNVPLSLDKAQLIKRLGIDPRIVKSIHFRSLPVESKFAMNKRVGIIRGRLTDAKSSQNAYVTLVDEKYVEELLQKNTMEIDGHYLFINKTPPSSFSKFNRKKTIFVGRLPKDTTENELFDVFSNISPVKGVRIIRDPKTSESKGFGFVAFDNRTAVPEAIEAFNNKTFKGYTLHVMKALDHEAAAAQKAKGGKKRGKPTNSKRNIRRGDNKDGKRSHNRTIKSNKKNKQR